MRVALCACLLAPLAAVAGVTGVVLEVPTGDSVRVLVREDVLEVHLRDVDAPAEGEPFAAPARASLAELCANKAVLLDDFGIEPGRHVVADASCEGADAATEQVRRGMARVHVESAPGDTPLLRVQADAQAARRGLWNAAAGFERAAERRR